MVDAALQGMGVGRMLVKLGLVSADKMGVDVSLLLQLGQRFPAGQSGLLSKVRT
jgi:predicted N-acetyltransferase YhbS